MLEHEELTEAIIGAAIQVQRVLGPGFLEAIYHRALCVELGKRGLRFVREPVVMVFYEGQPVGKHRLDLVVEELIVVELKAIESITDTHLAVVRSYLRATGKKHGLVLNFAKVPLEIRRVLAI